jgi:hypothetical protein
LLTLEIFFSNFLAFVEKEIRMLSSKNKVADEKKLVQNGKFETFKDRKLSLGCFSKMPFSKIIAVTKLSKLE